MVTEFGLGVSITARSRLIDTRALSTPLHIQFSDVVALPMPSLHTSRLLLLDFMPRRQNCLPFGRDVFERINFVTTLSEHKNIFAGYIVKW